MYICPIFLLQYNDLLDDSKNLLASLCAPDRIIDMIDSSVSGEMKVWLDSVYSAINGYRIKYPSYCDLVQPLNGAYGLVSYCKLLKI